ncbi:MAG: hypothetical protein AAGA48_36475 [Myxococcota bacterium]
MLRRSLAVSGLALALMGCPEFESASYSIDLKNQQITVILKNLHTNDATKADEDLAFLLAEARDPSPEEGITDVKVELYEDNGMLNAKWTGTFANLEAAEIFQYDRKSPLMWCTSDSLATLATETGKVTKLVPNCVFFDRKAKQLEFTLSHPGENITSLLPQFKAYKASNP